MLKSKSTLAKNSEVIRKWWLVDGTDQVLGRLSSRVASLLRGKHKPTYTPSVDTGDHVVIINASKIRLTGKKAEQKLDYRHSGYPGGQHFTLYKDLLAKDPEKMVLLAVKGMLPKNSLGRKMITKLRVYRDATNPHGAQKLEPYSLVK